MRAPGPFQPGWKGSCGERSANAERVRRGEPARPQTSPEPVRLQRSVNFPLPIAHAMDRARLSTDEPALSA